MEFYLVQRGRLAGYVVAVLIALWISAARHLVRYWSVHPIAIPVSVAACLAVTFGLLLLKPWARYASLAVLWAILIWTSLDVPWLVLSKSLPAWYTSIPLVGGDVTALGIVFFIDVVLLVLLYRCRAAFGGRDGPKLGGK